MARIRTCPILCVKFIKVYYCNINQNQLHPSPKELQLITVHRSFFNKTSNGYTKIIYKLYFLYKPMELCHIFHYINIFLKKFGLCCIIINFSRITCFWRSCTVAECWKFLLVPLTLACKKDSLHKLPLTYKSCIHFLPTSVDVQNKILELKSSMHELIQSIIYTVLYIIIRHFISIAPLKTNVTNSNTEWKNKHKKK